MIIALILAIDSVSYDFFLLPTIHRLRLRPRIMRDVSKRDLSTTVLGNPIAFPVFIAPTALHCMAHKDGERGTAKGEQFIPHQPYMF